jgi:5-methylcytosine-specific restriction protein A
MPRNEFDEKTRVKRLHFAEFKCEGMVSRDDGTKTRCNATLVKGRVEFDHDIAAELGGPATFDNCRALCKICHREKYPSDAAKIAKAKRREVADVGARAPPSKPINSAGFSQSPQAAARAAAREARGERIVARGPTAISRRFV